MATCFGPGAGLDGSSSALAAPSAKAILQTNPNATSGIYWIKQSSINSGNAFQAYCDMSTDGGGWILLVCNSSINGSTKLNYTNYSLYNQASPTIATSYSILAWADGLKNSTKPFQFMMEAGVRGQLGGIWTANDPSYTFNQTSNAATNITLNIQFGNWSYNDSGLEARMPYVSSGAGKLTTSADPNNSWWGTLIENSSSFSPAPWMGSGAGTGYSVADAGNPGIIWYWVRPL